MCKFIRKSNERILWTLSQSEILRLYSIVYVARETTKMSVKKNIFFTCQVSACELQPFSCHDLANDIYSETAKTVFSHLKWIVLTWGAAPRALSLTCCAKTGLVRLTWKWGLKCLYICFLLQKKNVWKNQMLWVQKIVTPSLPDRTK